MATPIASLQNTHIKAVVKLGKRCQRDRTRTTLVAPAACQSTTQETPY